MEVTLVNTMSRETILREYINVICNAYDVIILDCMPSLGMLTINALATADEVLIPVQAQYLTIKGLEQLMRTIAKVKRQINPKLSIRSIVVTMADMRTNYAKEIMELLHNLFQSPENRCSEGEKVQKIDLTDLYPFRDHPFKVLDDEAMANMVKVLKHTAFSFPELQDRGQRADINNIMKSWSNRVCAPT